jgi:hydrogenase-1 operon protein HyaF
MQNEVKDMSGLDSIPVVVEGDLGTDLRTQNLKPLMLQIEQALQDLLDAGSATVIDLAAMPFSSQDEEDLRQLLGQGEVSATLDVFGQTLIQETALPGVWLVEHKDGEERRLTLHLEINRVPSILVTPVEDIAEGLVALKGEDEPPEPAPDK